MALEVEYYQEKLIEEKKRVEQELSTIAHRNPDAPEDWQVNYPDMNVMPAAKEEIADQEEEFENRASLEIGLESRIRDINDALERIKNKTFGICKEGGEPIAEERLKANPAARNCIAHEPVM